MLKSNSGRRRKKHFLIVYHFKVIALTVFANLNSKQNQFVKQQFWDKGQRSKNLFSL
jgi:hypothetical protein